MPWLQQLLCSCNYRKSFPHATFLGLATTYRPPAPLVLCSTCLTVRCSISQGGSSNVTCPPFPFCTCHILTTGNNNSNSHNTIQACPKSIKHTHTHTSSIELLSLGSCCCCWRCCCCAATVCCPAEVLHLRFKQARGLACLRRADIASSVWALN